MNEMDASLCVDMIELAAGIQIDIEDQGVDSENASRVAQVYMAGEKSNLGSDASSQMLEWHVQHALAGLVFDDELRKTGYFAAKPEADHSSRADQWELGTDFSLIRVSGGERKYTPVGLEGVRVGRMGTNYAWPTIQTLPWGSEELSRPIHAMSVAIPWRS